MTPLEAARGHLTKAEEFLAEARSALASPARRRNHPVSLRLAQVISSSRRNSHHRVVP